MRAIAQQGDTLDLLCHRHLGRTDGIVEAALEMNPGLAAKGPVLPIGTEVLLPDAPPPAAKTDLVQLWN